MDDRRLARFAAQQGGLFTTQQLIECGLSSSGIRSRLLSERIFRVERAVYSASPHQDEWSRRWAALLSVKSTDAALSHWSAAAVHELRNREPPVPHVLVPSSWRSRVGGTRVHRTRSLLPSDVVVVRGLRVTTVPRTILDLAPYETDDVVLAMIREGEYRRLIPTGAMLRMTRTHPTHPGVARIRRVDPATTEAEIGQTPLDRELRELLDTLPLPTADREVWVRGGTGARYRFDRAWHPFKLAAEADGRNAHARSTALESDRFRDNDLAAEGWLTMRFTRPQLTTGRLESGRQLLATAIRRGWKP
jgi:hypothetical protein